MLQLYKFCGIPSFDVYELLCDVGEFSLTCGSCGSYEHSLILTPVQMHLLHNFAPNSVGLLSVFRLFPNSTWCCQSCATVTDC